MYALTIIETNTFRQADIARIILESGGFPTVAATISLPGIEPAHAAFTSAPDGYPESVFHLVKLFDAMGEQGLERVKALASTVTEPDHLAVPKADRDGVRNALLATIYTVASAEHGTVTSEPSASTVTAASAPTVNHDPGDEHNPSGGGFDGECIGADKWDSWKPGRDIAADQYSW